MKLADWIMLIENAIKKDPSPLVLVVYDSISQSETYNSTNYAQEKTPSDLPDLYKIFHDWCIDNEPDYVSLAKLLDKGIIKLKYYKQYINMKNAYGVNYPYCWHISNYFYPKNPKDGPSYTYSDSLSVLFERIVNAIILFKEIYGT